MFISYAQNLEDVVLRRALRSVQRGTYVDVGASDPVLDSLTWAFYLVGWRGVNVEPVPRLAEALRRQRPEDITFEFAAGTRRGTARLFCAENAGTSTLDPALASEAFEPMDVVVAPLDELLADAGLSTDAIHFCSIDVEGAEAAVLEGFDLERWRPWILVIEATEPNTTRPNQSSWEPGILEAGYRFCLFDGLNRFYVREERAAELGPLLSYPACVFDQPFERAGHAAVRNQLARASASAQLLAAEKAQLESALSAMKRTISWRATKPLRVVRRRQLDIRAEPVVAGARADAERMRAALMSRLRSAISVIDPESERTAHVRRLDDALDALASAIVSSPAADEAKAWLATAAVDGAFPDEAETAHVARLLRMDGAPTAVGHLERRWKQALDERAASTVTLQVIEAGTIVDVTHTLETAVHTGIQRVVRETVTRWADAGHALTLASFDSDHGTLRAVSSKEGRLLHEWQRAADEHSHSAGDGRNRLLVPWRCHLVLPELATEPRRCESYRALVVSDVLASFGVIGYDLIPITASETAADGMPDAFTDYVSLVKRANRISAISAASAHDFAALASTAEAQGRPVPVIAAQSLPTEAPTLTDETVHQASRRLGVVDANGPLVLMVGSLEPRKNHIRVLEASERLWRRGERFALLMIGGNSWKSEELDAFVEELVSRGRPLSLVRNCGDDDLWAAYRLARFTVFPSLVEGFGLPVAESLATGTPVVTSAHGSLAEIAEGGGCVTVDPYDVDSIESAMASLLEDDVILERLRNEARARTMPGWAEYADDVWAFLVEGRAA